MSKIVTAALLFIGLLYVLVGRAFADSEMPPSAYVSASDNGRFYFKMMPDPADPYDIDSGFGTMFRVVPAGKDRIMWRTSGWYARTVYVSGDGLYLVRVDTWPRGSGLSAKHMAVAFYKKGKLLKRYSTQDLVKDPSAVRKSSSHYFYLVKLYGLSVSEKGIDEFSLLTVDKMKYSFEVSTGDILSAVRFEESDK